MKNIDIDKFNEYSFKDIEYSVKLMYLEIDDINIAIKVYNKLLLESKRSPSTSFLHHIDGQLEPFRKKIVKIQKKIASCEEELCDRLLTGNDDGTVMRELLGATGV